jgi:hypothetical protein
VQSNRSGVALVFFAMLVFGLMGIMAFVIDIGVASLTQAQMQNAVDAGALDGMRLRDFEEHRFESDPHRRAHVSELVQMVFDDNLHPTGGVNATPEPPWHGGIAEMPPDSPDVLRLGAGPIWSLQPGEGPGNVGEQYDPFPGTYDDPVLQANTSNALVGDMLSGTYFLDPTFADPTFHVEHSDYSRVDFGPATNNPAISQRAISFLVRMRRASDIPLPQVGVATGAPPLPLLFGLGSTVRQSVGSDWNPRTDGITVRAVAIASARPAMMIGPPPDMQDLIGNPMLGMGFWYTTIGPSPVRMLAPPLALTAPFWSQIPLHSGQNLTEDPTQPGSLKDSNGIVVGTFLMPDASSPATVAGGSIGMPIVGGPAPQNVPTSHFVCYFPIQAPIPGSSSTPTNRVVGFGYGDIEYNGAGWTITKGFQNEDQSNCAMYVAPNNASARMSPDTPPLSSTERDNLFAAYFNFGYRMGSISFDWQDINAGTVLAPVLVR